MAQIYIRRPMEASGCTYEREDYSAGPRLILDDIALILVEPEVSFEVADMHDGDVVYTKDVFYAREAGNWTMLPPGEFTQALYELTETSQ